MPTIPDHAKKVFDGIIFDVYHYEQPLFDGTSRTFELLKRNDSVQCIPIVEDKILVIRDSQPNRETLWALPGGQTDAGENLLDAVSRELLEETGYTCDLFELYTRYDISSKVDWHIHTYIARGAVQTNEPVNEPGEQIESFLVSFDEFIDIATHPDFREKELAMDILRMYKEQTLDAFRDILFNTKQDA